jgi:cytochrome c-type biogenesis protein CcmF
MGVGPLARWQRAPLPQLWVRLRWALVSALLLGSLLPFVWGGWSALTALGLFLAAWVVLSAAVAVKERLHTATPPTPAWCGMLIAHVGVAVFIVGVTLVRSYQVEIDVRMAPGDTVSVGGHVLTFEGVHQVAGPNYQATRGSLGIAHNGRSLGKLHPEKRHYTAMPTRPMTEAAIHSGVQGDVYVALAEEAGQGAWALRAHHKPFVSWIWGGCAFMALGGLLALAGRRSAHGVAPSEP